ncbi:MAG: ThiF family adenylyltransferase [Acidobacteriota bacterium]|nr:ThiF family adenylyltransferase [Acidobacteriota bacterium]
MNEHNASPVSLTPQAYQDIRALCDRATERRTETVFYLVGRRLADRIEVTAAVRPGNPVEGIAHTSPDLQTAPSVLRPYVDQGLSILGEGHRHNGLIGPSGGDHRTLRDKAPRGYLCLVASTTTQEPTPVLTAHSINETDTLLEHPVAIQDEEYHASIPASRQAVKVIQFGAGSGGCLVALHATKLGIKELTLVDHDRLEDRNLERHLSARRDIGDYKTKSLARFLRARTTTKITTLQEEITPGRRDRLRGLVQAHDYVLNCTGHPIISNLLSETGKEAQRTVLHAGVFARGTGGFVFRQTTEGACYACLFPLTRRTTNETTETLDQLEEHYGFTREELHAQAGLWTDVSTISTLHAKILAETLKRDPTPDDHNLWVIDNRRITITSLTLRQHATCPTCNPPNATTQEEAS